MMKKIIPILLTILGLTSLFSLSAQFENPLEELDFTYSEKNLQKYIQKAADSKNARIEQAFSNATGEGLREGLVPYFANLWLGKDLKKTNKVLLDILAFAVYLISDAIRIPATRSFAAYGDEDWTPKVSI
jgi:hypothetical protein